jgi:hypothetical protein
MWNRVRGTGMLLGVRALRKLILGFWSSGWGGGLALRSVSDVNTQFNKQSKSIILVKHAIEIR